ncbi:MAG: signal peptidase II [Pirellulales bacterium]
MLDVPRSRYILFGAIAAAGCGVDLVSKAWLFSWPELAGGNVHWLWPGHAGFQLSWNEGALFGMGQGSTWLFATLSVLAGCAIPLWLFHWRAASDLWLTAALGSVMGGLLGNLYDRLGLPDYLWPGRSGVVGQPVHAVRDWILVQWSDQWRWPNFNIADSLLVVGAIALVWHATRNPSSVDRTPDAASDAPPVG